MSAEGDGAGDGAEDPDAPAAELTPEERLSLEMDAFEARWGKKKRVAEQELSRRQAPMQSAIASREGEATQDSLVACLHD